MSERERPSLSVSLSLVSSAWVICHRYEDRAPILSISGGPAVHLTISPPSRVPTAADVESARALLAAVRTYVAECERFVSDAVPAGPVAA